MASRVALFISFILCSLVPLSKLSADELRVVDNQGLTRAVKEISAPTSITIHLASRGNSESQLVLRDLDGLHPTQRVSSAGKKVVTTKIVPAGVWEITLSTKEQSTHGGRIHKIRIGGGQ